MSTIKLNADINHDGIQEVVEFDANQESSEYLQGNVIRKNDDGVFTRESFKVPLDQPHGSAVAGWSISNAKYENNKFLILGRKSNNDPIAQSFTSDEISTAALSGAFGFVASSLGFVDQQADIDLGTTSDTGLASYNPDGSLLGARTLSDRSDQVPEAFSGGLGTRGISSPDTRSYGSGAASFGRKSDGGVAAATTQSPIYRQLVRDIRITDSQGNEGYDALSKDLVADVIDRSYNRIRYCYQRELAKNPALSGEIDFRFVIGRDGTVSSVDVTNTTMHNAAVASGIAVTIKRMNFPPPMGGGTVIVTLPLFFDSSV